MNFAFTFTCSRPRQRAVSYSTQDKILIMGGDDEDARQTGVVLSAGDFISITWGSEKGAIRSADPDEFLLAG